MYRKIGCFPMVKIKGVESKVLSKEDIEKFASLPSTTYLIKSDGEVVKIEVK